MRIEIVRRLEKKIKGRASRLGLRQKSFTIVSNNCWGTFIYKKFDLPYQSPFINALIYASDYIRLLENFSPEILKDLSFIKPEQSKHLDEMKSRGYDKESFPIGVIGDNIEIHFLHYKEEEDALNKWNARLKRIDYDHLIFKFSDSERCDQSLIERFDALPFKNKICFSAKSFPELKSVVTLKYFKGKEGVIDEWKHSEKEYSIRKLLNNS